MPALVPESGARGKQLEAPHRSGIEDANLAPLRSGEGSGAETRSSLEEEDLGSRDLLMGRAPRPSEVGSKGKGRASGVHRRRVREIPTDITV